MTIKHTTITDVINREVAPALGEFVDDFDVEAIAREAFEYVGGAFVQREDVDFWEVAKAHDVSGMVLNDNGNWVNFEAAVNYMNDDLREEIHAELAPCKDQAFFDAYCERHEKKFGEVFAPAIDCW